MRCRRQAPIGRHANPTLAGGSDGRSGLLQSVRPERDGVHLLAVSDGFGHPHVVGSRHRPRRRLSVELQQLYHWMPSEFPPEKWPGSLIAMAVRMRNRRARLCVVSLFV